MDFNWQQNEWPNFSFSRAMLRDELAAFAKDVRAEGVANMVIAVCEDWNRPLSEGLIKSWHGALLASDSRGVAAGAFRSHKGPMRVIRTNAYGDARSRRT